MTLDAAEIWWVALITFERTGVAQDILPEDAQGACGGLACLAVDSDGVRDQIALDLRHHGLRLLEVDDERALLDGELDDLDERLAENFRTRELEKKTVWGTLHVYVADGEA